jgi:hypothetical protein
VDDRFLISVLVLPPVVFFWWRRRGKIARGDRCWDCCADLTGRPLYVDLRGQSRCPKCGNLMDVTDVYKMPRQDGD